MSHSTFDDALPTFFAESRELLEEMEGALLALLERHDAREAIGAVFRAAHTIKGSAGLFGLHDVVSFTHVMESVLDRARDGALDVDAPLVSLLLQCRDHLSTLVEAVAEDPGAPRTALQQAGTALLAQLEPHLGTGPSAPGPDLQAAPLAPGDSDAEDHWHLSLRFGADVLRHGMDPLSFLRYLGRLGTLAAVVPITDRLPALDEMDPESCYLGFEIGLRSAADKATLEGAFEFVMDDCQVHIVPPRSRVGEYLALIEHVDLDAVPLGEILVRCGSITERELAQALSAQQATAHAHPLGEILVETGTVAPAVVDAALDRQRQMRENRQADTASVRVDAHKLDRLITLVGELITVSAGATLAARRTGDGAAMEASTLVSSLVEDVRDSALQLRMVKIGATFGRFRRVVHEVARELGKDIQLVIRGEDTELDKTLVEKIADPLTHLVRNAMDHGIEPAARREAAGKPAQGTVTLNAFHDSGSIVIEVSDDGGGLHRDRILAKAVERGLVDADQELNDEQVFALIFEPGFSTAEQVTNLSGRGVGMDVVMRNITALRGSVSVHSDAGRGTTVSVRLPLTLAIINGFQVAVGRSVFVLPLDMVEECVAFSAEPERDYTNLRGQVLPFIRLRELFELPGQAPRRENIVVLRHGKQRMGLVVDRLLGESQTVIKPLSPLFSRIEVISGSSIQGNGEVALILDVPALMHRIQHRSDLPLLPH